MSMADDTIDVRVLLFAGLREHLGRGEIVVRTANGSTPATLWPLVMAGSPPPAGLRHAVNGSWAQADHRLRDGDVVAMITAVSGG